MAAMMHPGVIASSVGPPPTDVTLTSYPTSGGATAGVQRDTDATTGSPKFAGTYSGGTPTGFQGRVRLVSDDSVVTDWTDLSDLTFDAGAYSGTLAGVPQGDGYYRDVRVKNATAVTATSSTPFLIGIGVIMYGQSNMAYMTTSGASAPAAAAGTTYFNGTNFVAVPGANGVREMLNRLRSLSGVPCFALNGAMAGRTITALSSPGDGTYANLITQVATGPGATGPASMEVVTWHQGEGDSNGLSPTVRWDYVSFVDTLHGQLCSSLGRTRAQLPFVLGGLSTVTEGSGYLQWRDIQRAIQLCDNPPLHRYYSHSQVDIPNDGLHYYAAGYGLVGKRFGQTAAYALGLAANKATFFISAVTPVNGTTVDVTLAHNLGDDFTPTSGITGFEVSEDGGKTWLACTGARQDASTIRLTHTATTRNRVLMYGRGLSPDMSNPVRDNSDITTGLSVTAVPLEVEPVHTPDFVKRVTLPAAAPWLNYAGTVNVGPGFTGRRFVVSAIYPGTTGTLTAATVNGNAATIHAAHATGASPAGFVFSINDEASTSLTLSLTFSAGFFANLLIDIYILDENRLTTKTAPVATSYVDSLGASVTTVAADIATEDGGVAIAVAANTNISSNTADITGSNMVEQYVTSAASGLTYRGEAAANTVAETATVTATWANAQIAGIMVSSWK